MTTAASESRAATRELFQSRAARGAETRVASRAAPGGLALRPPRRRRRRAPQLDCADKVDATATNVTCVPCMRPARHGCRLMTIFFLIYTKTTENEMILLLIIK